MSRCPHTIAGCCRPYQAYYLRHIIGSIKPPMPGEIDISRQSSMAFRLSSQASGYLSPQGAQLRQYPRVATRRDAKQNACRGMTYVSCCQFLQHHVACYDITMPWCCTSMQSFSGVHLPIAFRCKYIVFRIVLLRHRLQSAGDAGSPDGPISHDQTSKSVACRSRNHECTGSRSRRLCSKQ